MIGGVEQEQWAARTIRRAEECCPSHQPYLNYNPPVDHHGSGSKVCRAGFVFVVSDQAHCEGRCESEKETDNYHYFDAGCLDSQSVGSSY